MPQYPQITSIKPDGSRSALVADVAGRLLTVGGGISSSLNITAAAVVKATAGRVERVSVTTAGSTAGAVYDVATTGGVAAANLIATIPAVVGVYEIAFPANTGIVIVPGTGQVVSASYR